MTHGGFMKRIISLLAVLLFLASCEKSNTSFSKNSDLGWGLGSLFSQTEVSGYTIKVTTLAGTPIVNAEVLVGWAEGNPVAGNLFKTDSKGEVLVPTEVWTANQPVSIRADDYTKVTYFEQAPSNLTMKMRPAPFPSYFEIKGITTGYTIEDGDDVIDCSLAMPTFSRLDLLSFDMNSVVSPYADSLTIKGQTVYLPSNVSIPKQKEYYAIFNITLDKPVYRFYVDQPAMNKAFALRAHFPFRSVVDKMRNATPFFELINDISIEGGSFRNLNIAGASNNLDFAVNEITFKGKRTMKAPKMKEDEVVLAVSTAQIQGSFVPTDVKRLISAQSATLKTMDQGNINLVSVLKKNTEMEPNSPNQDRMSAALTEFTTNITPQFLPLMDLPKLVSTNEFQLPSIQGVPGINPLATFAMVSEVKEFGAPGTAKVRAYKRLWDLYAPLWASTMKLPEFPNENSANVKKHFEVSFLGSLTQQTAQLGVDVSDVATHVTHSSTDF